MGNNTFTKGYVDGSALTESEIDTALQSLKIDVSNTDQLTSGSSSGQILTSNGSGAAASFQTAKDPKPLGSRNFGLSASTSSGSLTVFLKTAAGTNPTGSDSVDISFSSSGANSSVETTYTQAASLSLTVTASASLGINSLVTAALYVYAIRQSSSALRLGISTNPNLDKGNTQTCVSMSSSSDIAGVLYSNASAGTYPVKLLGWISASHASGVWNNIYSVNLSLQGRAKIWKSLQTSSFSTSSSTFVDVMQAGTTNAIMVQIGTSGSPVQLSLVPGAASRTSGAGACIKLIPIGTTATIAGEFALLRGTTTIAIFALGQQNDPASANYNILVPPGAVNYEDEVSAGTYTYKLQARVSSISTQINILNCQLRAMELGA